MIHFAEAIAAAAALNYRSEAKRFCFLIFDSYSQWSEDMTDEIIESGIRSVVGKGINLSMLYDHSRTELSENSKKLIQITEGYDGSNLGAFYKKRMAFMGLRRFGQERVIILPLLFLSLWTKHRTYLNSFTKR